MVSISYLGHSCFMLEDAAGRRLVTDPFHSVNEQKPHLNIGYPEPGGAVDFVLVSHAHADHSAVEVFDGSPLVVSDADDCRSTDLKARLVPAWHDDRQGAEKGAISIMVWKWDGLRFCHLGDLGQSQLADEQLAQIGQVDVLFLPVGGGFTVDPLQAVSIAQQISPRLVIPMHYRCEQVPFLPYPLDDFLAVVPADWQRLTDADSTLCAEDALACCGDSITLQVIRP